MTGRSERDSLLAISCIARCRGAKLIRKMRTTFTRSLQDVNDLYHLESLSTYYSLHAKSHEGGSSRLLGHRFSSPDSHREDRRGHLPDAAARQLLLTDAKPLRWAIVRKRDIGKRVEISRSTQKKQLTECGRSSDEPLMLRQVYDIT